MRKNNKGFAISTMLYGLLIVMVLLMALLISTMAFTRNNNKKFVEEIMNEMEFRENNPPKVSVVATNEGKVYPAYSIHDLNFTITIEDDSSLSISDRFHTSITSSLGINPVCSLDNTSTDRKKIYSCKITTTQTTADATRITITIPEVRDIYLNKQTNLTYNTGYSLGPDTEKTTMKYLKGSLKNKQNEISASVIVSDNSGTLNLSKLAVTNCVLTVIVQLIQLNV